MKTSYIKNLKLAFVLCTTLAANFAKAQCSTSFTYSVGANGNVTFSSTSSPYSPSVTIYYWDFGMGNAAANSAATYSGIPTASFTYSANGNYAVNLLIMSAPTCSASYFDTVVVNTAPCALNANFSISQGANGGTNYTYFTNTTTNAGSGTSYLWNFGDGSNTTTQVSPVHSYSVAGTYTVTLTATDNNYTPVCVSTQTSVVIINQSGNPLCNLNADFTYTQSTNGHVDFTNASSGNIVSVAYQWNFGDGSSSTAVSPSHNYANNGSYIVTLIATNSVNPQCYDSTAYAIAINTSTCIANTTFSLVPSATPHNWYAVLSNTANIANATWNWGDSTATSISSGLFSSHTYSVAGNYQICLTVSMTCGAVGSYCNSQYFSKSSGTENDIIHISSITPEMLVAGIKNNAAQNVSYFVSPNPSNGEFGISINGLKTERAKIQVYNFVGTLVFESEHEVSNGILNKNMKLDNASNGVYFIKVGAGGTIYTRKLIISK